MSVPRLSTSLQIIFWGHPHTQTLDRQVLDDHNIIIICRMQDTRLKKIKS